MTELNPDIEGVIARWEARTGCEAINARQADKSDLSAVIEGFKADRHWLDQNWQETDRMCRTVIQSLESMRVHADSCESAGKADDGRT